MGKKEKDDLTMLIAKYMQESKKERKKQKDLLIQTSGRKKNILIY